MAGPGADFTASFIDADGRRLRCLAAGQGAALICLHGAGGPRLSRAHALLAARYRVVALDLPGFGHSPVDERLNDLPSLAATMTAAVARLGLERATVMGHGFGASVALSMALLRPEAVRSLVLIAPGVLGRVAPPPYPAAAAERLALRHAHPERHEAPTPPDAAIEARQQALVRRLADPTHDGELARRLTAITAPVLALFGTGDRVSPPEAAHLYRAAMRNCHIVLVYDAAHAIDADRPEAVASVVADFIEREERFLVNTESALIHP